MFDTSTNGASHIHCHYFLTYFSKSPGVKVSQFDHRRIMVGRLVNTKATELKLGTLVPRGAPFSHTESRLHLNNDVDSRGHKLEDCISSLLLVR